MNKLQEILSDSLILQKMYDIARIVDPVEKNVLKFSDNGAIIENFKCYDFWLKNRICDNCISMRAYNDNAAFIKMEFNKEKIYLITALPYELDNRRVVIELLKEVTNNLVLEKDDFATAKMNEIHNLIENMNHLAFMDSLTGVYNRRYINEKLPVEILRSSLSGATLALLMCDIDYFKDINDNYGHLVGDAALKKYASLLETTVSAGDGWVARFGGDEFLACIPNIDIRSATEAGENLNKSAEGIEEDADGVKIALSSSIGIYIVEPDSNVSAEEALRLVDEKMYLAKNKGRNRVEY